MRVTEHGQSDLRRTHDVNGLEFNLNIAADERRRRRDLNITSHVYLGIGHIAGAEARAAAAPPAGHVPAHSATGPLGYPLHIGAVEQRRRLHGSRN